MTAHLAHIVRHPIKSIGYEEIGSASLTRGRAVPFDRHWALSHAAAKFAGPLTDWAAKMNFVRGVAAPGLMAVQARTLPEGRLELSHPDLPGLSIEPARAGDQARLIDWLRPLWPENRPAPRALEQVPGLSLGDMRDQYVSILSLSSLAALGAAAGVPLSPHRFRGNLWVEGWPQWSDRGLIGRHLRIGAAVLRIEMPITRCRATCANPQTGAVDVETLDLLGQLNGDTEFGLYATVTEGGEIARGAAVEIL